MSDYMKELERLLDAHERTLILHERGAAWAEEPMSTRAALLAHAAQADRAVSGVPDGWKLVPVEPTPEMLDAGIMCGSEFMNAPPHIAYSAMLAAAPTAPAQADRDAPVELPEPEAIERIATTRYRCVPIRLFGYKVVSGDGDRSLFEGTKDECYVVARKLTEAFLDGAHVAFRQMHQYGDAREAAGYARGVAEERERCAAICDRMGNPLNVKYEGGGCRKAAAAIRAAQKGIE